jgi:parallel beta-helix repeat protein
VGIEIGSGGKVVNCLARMNVNNGIQTGDGGSVIGCVAELNGGDGIFVSRGLVKDCVARSNTGNGINAFINCVVLDNTCLNNGSAGVGAGISAGTGGNRIEGNNVVNNPRGIASNPSTGNLIIRNSATGNTTNYDINIVNTAGPIITSASIGTNCNPVANYSY